MTLRSSYQVQSGNSLSKHDGIIYFYFLYSHNTITKFIILPSLKTTNSFEFLRLWYTTMSFTDNERDCGIKMNCTGIRDSPLMKEIKKGSLVVPGVLWKFRFYR